VDGAESDRRREWRRCKWWCRKVLFPCYQTFLDNVDHGFNIGTVLPGERQKWSSQKWHACKSQIQVSRGEKVPVRDDRKCCMKGSPFDLKYTIPTFRSLKVAVWLSTSAEWRAKMASLLLAGLTNDHLATLACILSRSLPHSCQCLVVAGYFFIHLETDCSQFHKKVII